MIDGTGHVTAGRTLGDAADEVGARPHRMGLVGIRGPEDTHGRNAESGARDAWRPSRSRRVRRARTRHRRRRADRSGRTDSWTASSWPAATSAAAPASAAEPSSTRLRPEFRGAGDRRPRRNARAATAWPSPWPRPGRCRRNSRPKQGPARFDPGRGRAEWTCRERRSWGGPWRQASPDSNAPANVPGRPRGTGAPSGQTAAPRPSVA